VDLSLPLRSLVPSLDSDVLAVLAGTESALGATQVARLSARGSRQGVSVVLDRLAEHGLVLAHPTNKGHAYQLNREHLLAPVLLAALEVRGRAVELLGEQTGALFPPALHVSVFGSFARGQGDAGSNIDLLVVVPDGHDSHAQAWVAQLQQVQDRVLAATGNRLEPLVLSLDGLRKAAGAGEPLVDSLSADSVRLHGPAFEKLLRHEDVR
jgi:predicted nucleotidyltransferase